VSESGTGYIRRDDPALMDSTNLSRDGLERSILTGKLRLSDGSVGIGREVVHHDVMHTVAAPPWEGMSWGASLGF